MSDPRVRLFEEVAAVSRPALLRICRAYVPDGEPVDDLLQDMLLAVWTSLDRFRNEAARTTYVYRIALNTALGWKSRQDRRPRTDRLLAEPVDEPEPVDERLTALRTAIRRLPEADRQVVMLLLEDLSYAEIASVLDMSVNLVGVRINRAKKKLLQMMET